MLFLKGKKSASFNESGSVEKDFKFMSKLVYRLPIVRIMRKNQEENTG